MPEPTTTAAATVGAGSVTLQALTLVGVPLGLRADLLVAGFSGALVAIVLLNSVPSAGDTWQLLFRATLRRIAVAVASSITAGYLAPLLLLLANLPPELLLGVAFAIGGGAQHVLRFVIRRLTGHGVEQQGVKP